ncbi:hypothetical protein Pmani_038829 [Petrolisthes manimaculis]|uniref:ENPP1-3/EXOG-like endonuclease/phosphodiesterase domain-containing protein n=1 Tax=Petrolisthes manimaculis TaxID=1843537 RepID=A0AAE1NDM5_9EUCA|nr:hypothetical protein Pmani_038829 [Petrolisthes manimaculis]
MLTTTTTTSGQWVNKRRKYYQKKQQQQVTPPTPSCPTDFKTHPLILVSMDGFRADYLDRGLTPTIQYLVNEGVRAPYMKPSYPTITFPNHYTIVTGLYPPAHGIVANRFYDPEFKAKFALGQPEMLQKRFYGGEPVWKTAELQGKKAATYFWPGSETEGNTPSLWFPYNESIPFNTRAKQVLSWLDLPAADRPDFLTLYMHQPDRAGHNFGPASWQVDAKLKEVDAAVALLLKGLRQRGLEKCVNLLVVSDHGMAEAGQSRAITIDDYIPDVATKTRFWKGIFSRFTPNTGNDNDRLDMMKALACKKKEMRVYEKKDLPVRWHVPKHQGRIEEVVLDLDAGYSAGADDTFKADAGDHGYDNYFHDMNTLFVALGPDFRRDFEVEAFQNIELYNLMCHLLDITPAPNNGTWGALNHLLASPPTPPTLKKETPPTVATLPDSPEAGECPGDPVSARLVSRLEAAQKKAPQYLQQHLTWGVPQMGSGVKEEVVMLVQPDYVAGYSLTLKMPLWTSYSLTMSHWTPQTTPPWMSDPRLKASERLPCQDYDVLAGILEIEPYPLFPQQFSSMSSTNGELSYLISNALPVTSALRERLDHLEKLLNTWTNRYSALNVVAGPVFDSDADTLADDLHDSGDIPFVLPNHIYVVVTRCLEWRSDMADCPHSKLDALAFVLPQFLAVSNCLDDNRFIQEFSAKVRDVELITGLTFYPDVNFQDRVKLQVRMHSNIWGLESWKNRIWWNHVGTG